MQYLESLNMTVEKDDANWMNIVGNVDVQSSVDEDRSMMSQYDKGRLIK